jgi:hypothetical protein
MARILAPIAVLSLLSISGCDPGEISYPEEIAEEEGEKSQPAQPRPLPEEEGCELGDVRECEEGEGTQFCDMVEGSMGWGECLANFECLPGDLLDCGLGGTVTCVLDEGVPMYPICPFTPLVLSFEVGQPIEMLGSDAAFDIAGVGECLDSDWPSATTPWLAADLDRNGFIDAGHELFGSGTILESGRHAPHGFVALAPFDGNRDGRITAADPRFGELLVWRDEDGDKLSLPHELTSLAEAGVQAIELDYHVLEQCDARGNCGRERSRFSYVDASGKAAVGEVVDMYLACD